MTGNRIDTIRSDNGGEFFTTDFATWPKEKGIRQESSAPYTPEQNGVAERLNRTIVESARSMLHSAQVPIYLWAEAVNCAVYLQNRSASKSIKNTPYEIWKGVKPNITHLRVFGSEVFVHVPKGRRGKFDPKAIKCLHMGYSESQKAFRAWDLISRKILISRDVIFNENIKQDQTKQNSSTDFTTDSTSETTREEPALSYTTKRMKKPMKISSTQNTNEPIKNKAWREARQSHQKMSDHQRHQQRYRKTHQMKLSHHSRWRRGREHHRFAGLTSQQAENMLAWRQPNATMKNRKTTKRHCLLLK